HLSSCPRLPIYYQFSIKDKGYFWRKCSILFSDICPFYFSVYKGVGLFNICKDQALNQLEKQPIYNSFTVHLKSNG
ncbi:hypothetical protein M3649_19180, partial [Ureibacillus chungkukjangi]|uniref:hypothetical protein n=1 Tax=Ureibacillus chungkukjangi TaxID=1202712 RepID=UPI00203D8573